MDSRRKHSTFSSAAQDMLGGVPTRDEFNKEKAELLKMLRALRKGEADTKRRWWGLSLVFCIIL